MRASKILGCVLSALAALAWAPLASAGPGGGTAVFAADFNGDGNDDIAGSNPAASIQIRHLSGVQQIGLGSIPDAGGSFVIKAVGYGNNDDNADVTSQGNGTIRVSLLNAGGTAAASHIFVADGGGTWNAKAMCDTDNDGVDEVFAEGEGAALGAARITDVSTGAGVHSFISTAGGIWVFLFCADVNGDGDEDLVFNGTGAANGVARANLSGGSTAVFFAQGGGVWSLVGEGDTNDDGTDDLIDTGTGAATGFKRVRTLNTSGAVIASGFIPDGGGSQAFVFAGDGNNDGRDDLYLRSAATNKIAVMNADGISTSTSCFPPNGGGSATLDQGANTDGDGFVDLVSTAGAGSTRVDTIQTGGNCIKATGVLSTPGFTLF
jgi:hypothetical protein